VERKSIWNKLRGLFGGGDATDSRHALGGEDASPANHPGYQQLLAGVASTVGNVREHNEDNFYMPARRPGEIRGGDGEHRSGFDTLVEADGVYSFIVADGMGGQLAGEKASQMAVDLIPAEIAKRSNACDSDEKAVQRAIRDAVAAANQEILGLSHIQTEFSNMGTTVVLAVFRNNRVYVAGIGDSRAYRVRDGRIEQLTRDHSLADALVEAGTISKDELPNHKFKHILYLYLGSKDARSGPDEVRVAEVRPKDRFLLASDGLTGVVTDDVLTKIVESGDDPLETASRLVAKALENESKDNVTCMVIHAL
jgi:serine/threonine protein phosphatase PrpC